MALTREEVEDVKNQFIEKVLSKKPYNDYYDHLFGERTGTIYCRITNLRDVVHLRHIPYDLKENESLDDLCFVVGLDMKPPQDLFPDEYGNVKVFYEPHGEPKITGILF